MSGKDDDDDKQHEPTQKKLDDARKKGEVPRSNDLTTAASYAGFVLVGSAVGATSLSGMGQILSGILGRADTLSDQMFGGSAAPVGAALGTGFLLHLAPFAAVPMALALLCVVAQRAFTVTGSKLQPKLSRISILANARNKFGRSGLFEFAKSFVKLSIYSLILGMFLRSWMPDIMMSVSREPAHVTAMMLRLVLTFFMLVLIVALVIGGIDFLWQRAQHLRKNRMSHKDLTDESKESEGDPHMKNQRRQRAQEIAMNRMMADVPTADVVIVNPTHFAVALKWDRRKGRAPVCIAKGVDEIAARIRAIASENGVPLHSDPPTARLLHGVVGLGEEIRPDHYVAVAAAIRFAEAMRQKARQR